MPTAAAGMVCSVDRLASEAGIGLLAAGGSAADAAIAASAVLAVTSFHLCGMGGDLFALVHLPAGGAPRSPAPPGAPQTVGASSPFGSPGDLHVAGHLGAAGGPDSSGDPATPDASGAPGAPDALNASGRAGSGADLGRLRSDGHTAAMPFHHDLRSAPVPGCVDGWLALHERHGRRPLGEVLAPAIELATNGFPCSPLLAAASHLLPDPPFTAGDTVRRPGVARALRSIVEHGRAGFYEGEFGRGLLAIGGGEYTAADLARPTSDWVTPLRSRAWGHDLWTIPPNSQGYLTLLGARIAEGLPLPDDPDDGAWAHLLVEAARAAGHDRPAVLHEHADVTGLLADAEVARRRALIRADHRSDLPTGTAAGGTMHLCAGDADGMAVSLIQSNASGFGSLVFEPATGIGLHNRGIGFSVDPAHPAAYGPGRRPPHTLSPAMVTRPDGTLRAAIGTMGGDSQPQILLQLLARFLHHGQPPEDAIAAPRWTLAATTGFDTWVDPSATFVQLEATAPDTWRAGLDARGHATKVAHPRAGHSFGHAHLLERTATGWRGASDPRIEVGAAVGYDAASG